MNDKYMILPLSVACNKDLPDSAKILCGIIYGLTRKTSKCFATNDYLAKIISKTPRTVVNLLKYLQKYGYIEIEYDYDKNNHYVTQRTIKMSKNFCLFNEKNYSDDGKKVQSTHENDFEYNNIKANKISTNSVTPTINIIKNYVLNNNLQVNPQKFFDFYDKNNFMYRGKPINWQERIHKWHFEDCSQSVQKSGELQDYEIEMMKSMNCY